MKKLLVLLSLIALPLLVSADNPFWKMLFNRYHNTDSTSLQVDSNGTTKAKITYSKGFWNFISKEGVKVNGTQLSTYELINRYLVGTGGQFPTIPAAINWLKVYMTAPSELLLGGESYPIADSCGVQLAYPLVIRGIGAEQSKIVAATGLTGKPMFNMRSNLSFDRCWLDGSTLANYGSATGENFVNITRNDLYSEMTNFTINNFHRAVNITGGSRIFMMNGLVDSCFRGIVSNSTDTTMMDLYTLDFIKCKRSISLEKGAKSYFHLTGIRFDNSSIDTALYYDGTAYTIQGFPSITSCHWNNVGSFTKGFDFTRTDGRDANIYLKGNIGQEDKVPHAKVNVKDNTVTTTITSVSTTTNIFYTPTLATHTITLQFNAAATSGTFTITYGGQTTANINWNANDAAIKSALEALTNITTVTVTTVTGQTTWTIRFDTANEGWLTFTANIGSLGTTATAWYYGSSYTCKWLLQDNKFTYLASYKNDVWIDAFTGWLCDRNNVRYDVAIARYNAANVLQGYSSPVTGTMTGTATTAPSNVTNKAYFEDVVAGDYFRIVISKPTNAGDVVTLSDISMKITTQ